MKVLKNTNKDVQINYEYPLTYNLTNLDKCLFHEDIGQELVQNKKRYDLYMFIVETEFLNDEHWEDPLYLKKTNSIIVSKAREEARKRLMNQYMNNLQRDEFIAKHELPTWKYNYKKEDPNERKFIHKLEDEIFEFQENLEIFDIILQKKQYAKYKLDEDLYPVENEDEEFILETDPEIIKKQEKELIERMLAPRTQTLHERIYDMPDPFNHWDSRSFWHQFFFVEDKEENKCKYVRGNSGSSGSREYNGRWAHSFAYAAKRGIKIPTFHLIYDKHNQLKFHNQYDEFKCLPYDVSGNYRSNRSEIDELFSGCFIEVATKLEFN